MFRASLENRHMTENPFPDTGNLEIEIQRVDGTWYARVPHTTLWGRAATLEGAIAQLSQKQAEHSAFLRETGAAPLDLLDARPTPRKIWSKIGRIARLVAVIALCAIPISYALSTGIERGVEAAARQLHLRGMLANIEAGIIELGKPENDLSPERAKALRDAIGRIVERLSPFTSKATGLFEQGAKPAADDQPQDSN